MDRKEVQSASVQPGTFGKRGFPLLGAFITHQFHEKNTSF